MAENAQAIERLSIREPIPEIFEAWYLLSAAADAHLHGQYAAARALFARANMPEVYDWAWADWQRPSLNIRVPKPENDTVWISKADRDPVRAPTKAMKQQVLARDGYCCRYCGIPVIDADIRKLVRQHYPDAVPWVSSAPEQQHSAFSCMWLQYDHVVPHSHGGRSDEENIVVSCALCNFGKQEYTIRQLEVADPRTRPPAIAPWDGLERLRGVVGNAIIEKPYPTFDPERFQAIELKVMVAKIARAEAEKSGNIEPYTNEDMRLSPFSIDDYR